MRAFATDRAISRDEPNVSGAGSGAISLSPFRAFYSGAALARAGSSIMIGLVRAAMLSATLALGLVSAEAADKAFKRDDLADSAIKLEAQIKSDAGRQK